MLSPFHLNTYVMGLRPWEIFDTFSAGIDFRSQNLTSVDGVGPFTERFKTASVADS